MSVEYSLVNCSLSEMASRLDKYKIRLHTSFEKEINFIKDKEANDKSFEFVCPQLDSLLAKTDSCINKELHCQVEEPEIICTITSKKIYWEISLEELETLMVKDPGKFIIKGDDGSVIKNLAAFKKVITTAEKKF